MVRHLETRASRQSGGRGRNEMLITERDKRRLAEVDAEMARDEADQAKFERDAAAAAAIHHPANRAAAEDAAVESDIRATQANAQATAAKQPPEAARQEPAVERPPASNA